MLTFLKLAATLLILAAIFAWSFGVRKMANSGFFQHIDTLTVLVILGFIILTGSDDLWNKENMDTRHCPATGRVELTAGRIQK